jgi:surfeit locus 1 family protein
VRRLPIIPTLFVAGAVAVMIWLGVWQLQRATWKEGLIAELQAAPARPVVDLDPLLANSNAAGASLAFRRVLVTCHSGEAARSLRGGRNRAGQSGFSALLPCRPGAQDLAGRIEVNVGWTADPQSAVRPRLDGIVAGTLGTVEGGGPITLISAAPAAGLQPSAPPDLDDIPNNHMMYAFEWFFFAAAALVIYALAQRRRSKDRTASVAPGSPSP